VLEHVANYISLGLYVLPICWPDDHGYCACGKGHTGRAVGKAPLLLHGHLDASRDPLQVSRWWNQWPMANVAAALWPSRLVALDLDSPEAVEEARRLGLPENAPCAVTGGGGRQYYFRRPEGVGPVRRTKRGEARAIDVLTDGYTILPPSRHASGGVYRWLVPLAPVDELPEPPDWVIRLLFEKQYAADEDPELGPPPAEGEAEAAVKALRSVVGLLPKRAQDLIDNYVVTDDRSGQAWELGRLLVERGVRDPRTLAAVLYASGIHKSKWEERRDRWQDCCRIAARCLDAALADVEAAAADPLAGIIVPGETWIERTADLEWLWYPFLARGLSTTIAGGVRRGKTTFVSGLLALLTGGVGGSGAEGIDLGPMYIGYPVRPLTGRALLVSEEHQSVWRKRAPINWRLVDVVEDYAALTGAESTWERFLAEIRSGHWQLVIIDSLDVLVTARGARSENDAVDVTRVVSPLLSACRVSDTALLLLDHASKAQADTGGVDSVRGSSAKTGRSDVVVTLAEPYEMKNSRYRLLTARSRYDLPGVPEDGLVVAYNPETRLYDPVCPYSEWKEAKREQKIAGREKAVLEALVDGPKNATEIADALDLSRRTVTERLKELAKKGVVVSWTAKDGKTKVYALSEGGDGE